MTAFHHRIGDMTCLPDQTARCCALVTLISKLVLALLFACAYVIVRYWL